MSNISNVTPLWGWVERVHLSLLRLVLVHLGTSVGLFSIFGHLPIVFF